MPKHHRAAADKQNRKKRRKVKPVITEPTRDQAGPVRLAGLFEEPISATGDGSSQAQADRLGDPRFQTAQRQALAAEIGQVQGNQHLGKVVTSLKYYEKKSNYQVADSSNDKHQASSSTLVTPVIQTRPNKQQAVIQRDPQTITFDEPMVVTGRVAELGADRTSTQEIDNQLNNLKGAIRSYWSNYDDGLENFETLMSFESNQEAEPQYLNAALKATGKFILDQAIGALPPGLSQIAGGLKSIAEAWIAESSRAKTAAGGAKIGAYIVSVRNSIGPNRDAMLEKVESERTAIANRYSAVASSSPGGGQATEQGIVVGEAAEFINDLKKGVKAFKEAIPAAAIFQQQFTEAFAATDAWTDLVSQGGRPSGRLYISLSIYKDGDSWTLEDIGGAWTLATTAPKPERLAANLKSALDTQGLAPYQSNLPKSVSLRVEIEKDWALNDYQRGSIYFTSDPDTFEVRGWYDTPILRQAWANFKSNVLAVGAIRGSGK